MWGAAAVEVEVGGAEGAHAAPASFPCSSPTRNEALLLLSAAAAKPEEGTPRRGGHAEVPDADFGRFGCPEGDAEAGLDPGVESVPIACATIDTVPQAPPTPAEQAETILRQQQEIHALRSLCATQAAAIEQLRQAASACFSAAAPGTSPPPPYGPASPSTDELHLDADSPTKFPTTKDANSSAGPNAPTCSANSTASSASSSCSLPAGGIPPALQPLHSYHHAAHAAAAHAAAAYASYTAAHCSGSAAAAHAAAAAASFAYGAGGGLALLSDPRIGGITPAGDCGRPASAASAITAPPSARPPPTPKQPRTPASQLRHAEHAAARGGRYEAGYRCGGGAEHASEHAHFAAASHASLAAERDDYAAAHILHPHSRHAIGGGEPAYQHKRHRAGGAPPDGFGGLSAAPSAAASPSHHPARDRESSLPFSAVTLSLPPFRTTVSKPAGGGRAAGGGRTNTHVLWTPEEDACLRALVDEHGEQAWALVASRMPHERNNKQCRERWRNHLRPACNKGPWTEAEDALILERVKQHGTKWAKISGLYLPDRPENDIKNRWHILIRMQNQSASSNGTGAGAPPAAAAAAVPTVAEATVGSVAPAEAAASTAADVMMSDASSNAAAAAIAAIVAGRE